MNTATLPPPVAPIEPKPKPKLGVKGWLGIGIGVLILMGMIGSAFGSDDDTSSDTGLVAAADDGKYDADIERASLDMTWNGSKGKVAVCPPLVELIENGIDRATAIGFVIEGVNNEMNLSAAGEAHLRDLVSECF